MKHLIVGLFCILSISAISQKRLFLTPFKDVPENNIILATENISTVQGDTVSLYAPIIVFSPVKTSSLYDHVGFVFVIPDEIKVLNGNPFTEYTLDHSYAYHNFDNYKEPEFSLSTDYYPVKFGEFNRNTEDILDFSLGFISYVEFLFVGHVEDDGKTVVFKQINRPNYCIFQLDNNVQ